MPSPRKTSVAVDAVASTTNALTPSWQARVVCELTDYTAIGSEDFPLTNGKPM
jgi:hypothetical protein